MKLDWERSGVLRATLKVEEMAALVAGARLAAAALAARSPEQAEDLARVLASFDRALSRLGPSSSGGITGTGASKSALISAYQSRPDGPRFQAERTRPQAGQEGV